MKIRHENGEMVLHGEVALSGIYSGVGIETESGLFGVAQRDGGIEVVKDGRPVWSSEHGVLCDNPKAPGPEPSPRDFRRDLEGLINSHSKENGSDTPDFILAQYLIDCLGAWDRGVRAREWYGRREKE